MATAKNKRSATSRLTTSEVTEALRNRYKPKTEHMVADKWAFIQEVRDDAGHRARRSCDAIAMGLWPSEGLHLHGHEIKVSRSDWLKELNDPGKATTFSRFCHYWWIVAPAGIVVLDELPATWGLMVVNESHVVKVKRPATFNKKPDPVSYGFLASLLRRSLEQDEVLAKVRRAKQEGHKEGVASMQWRIDDLEKRQAKREEQRQGDAVKAVSEFEKASGIRLSAWNAARLGEAAAMLAKLDPQLGVRQLSELSMRAGKLAKAMEVIFSIDSED